MRNKIFTLSIFTILFFSLSANAQWVTNSNGINYNLGNVGIGTTSPSEALDVVGTIKSDYLFLNSINSNEGGELLLDGAPGYNSWSVDNFQGKFRLHHSGTAFFSIASNGNVGIGTSSPTSKLHVDGTGYFTDNITLADTKKINFADANNYISINSGVLKVLGNSSLQLGTILSGSEQINLYTDDTGNVGIGTSSPSRKLHVVGGALAVSHSGNQRLEISQDMNSNGTAIFDNQASIGDIKFQMSGSDKFMIARSGNVGIGTSSPLTLLQLRKDIGTAISPSHTSSNDISGIRFTNLSTVSNAGIVLNFQLGSTGTSHAAIAASRPSADHNILHFYTEHANSIAERMRINSDGNVGIGTTTPDSKLAVNGTIHTKEVKVDLTGWSDFVFEEDYDLPTLNELEYFISKNKHLPDVPTEAEVLANGILLGEMNAKLLQKIEELTLYLIDQNKKIENLQKEVSALKEDK